MTASSPPHGKRDTEHRHATVMFADISGFTALSERLDPEEVTTIINGCFERLESVVLAHGGTVDKYLGDCVKAVFGLAPHGGDAVAHAVHAALEMRAALYAFNRDAQLAHPLDIHIGIATGPVIAGMMGGAAKQEFTVMGATAELAARLEDTSHKGQIYVAAATQHHTAAEFEYRALPPLPLSDRQSVPVYELLDVKATKRITRQSERRQATVMFADLVGLDALAMQRSAQEVTELLNACFASFAATVVEHGGVVDKYLGGGIMALFGVPNAIEDAPKQALNSAIEIRNRLSRFNDAQQLPTPLQIHVGINTGLVIAGNIGGRLKREFTVMGDTVNLAARLKEAATPGSIYVGAETHRYTRQHFAYTALAPLELKGKAKAVPAYELQSATRQVRRDTPEASARMIFSAMVGRERELERITERIHELVAGRGGIVSLIGEAGMGKSRLMAEVAATVRQLDVTILEGRCLSIGHTLSFHPFIDLMRQWAGITDDEPELTAEAKLLSAISALLPETVAEVFPFIATLMGIPLHGAHAERIADVQGEALEKMMFKSVRELFQAIAARRPLVLVLEDLHWADQSSLSLLESLLRLAEEHRVLFINVFRPHYTETAERALRVARAQHEARHVEIQLEGLGSAHIDALIRNLLSIEDLSAATRTLIAQKAEGNPFYIEEVVRSLIDQGAVEYADGRFRVTAKIDTVVIPGTIQDVIMARVDRLGESARQMLQTASVIGRHFYYSIISHIMEREGSLDDDLALLQEKQLIEAGGGRWDIAVGVRTIADELEYMFKHALAQETVYQSVLLKTRRELHQRVAETIESLFAPRLAEFYPTLAYHYTRAEQLEPAERYLCRAGEQAISSAAFSEALHLFRDAATMYDTLHGATGGDVTHRGHLEKHLGLALLNTGQHVTAIDHFDRALACLGERVPANELARAVRWAVDMAVVLFRIYVRDGFRGPVPDAARQQEIFKLYFERGHAEVTAAPRRLFFETATPIRRYHRMDPSLIDEACGMYVSCAAIFAYSGLSFAVSKRMLEVAATLRRDDNVGDAFVYRSMLYAYEYLRGNWSDAPTIDTALIDEALRHGLLWDATIYLAIDMDRRVRRGDFASARGVLRKLADIRDTYEYAVAESNHNGLQIILLLEERKLRDALPLMEQHHTASHEGTLKVMSLGMVAKTRILLGDRTGAAEALRSAIEVTQREGVLSPWHQSIHHLAQLLFDVTALEDAAAHHDRSIWNALKRAGVRSARRALRTASKVARERVETYTLTGRLWWCLGNRQHACKWWSRSIAEAIRLGARPELARTYLDVGARLGATALDGIDASTYLEMAQRLFVELGLDWDLVQLTAVERRLHGAEPESAVA